MVTTAIHVPEELKAPAIDVIFSMPNLGLDEQIVMLSQMAKRHIGREYSEETLREALAEAMRAY